MIDQIFGHYRVLERIGAGGMGTVYRARDLQLDRDVALKVLNPSALPDDVTRKQFRSEALALARLNHPNIETIFEFNTQDGVDFLAMELVPGTPLSAKLTEGPLIEKDIVRQGLQLAEGLAAAHEQGIIHRDLKPANLFITSAGRLKILDFGLAKLADPNRNIDLTQTSNPEVETGLGTLPYMAPEQLRGQPGDARSDVYSAGTVFYEMATGKRPFAQPQALHLISAILQDQPASPSSINPVLSAGLEAVIAKALEKDPSRRYQTARELQVAFEGLATGLSSSGLRVTSARSKRSVWSAAVLTLLVVVVIGIIAFHFSEVGTRRYRGEVTTNENGSAAAPVKFRPAVAVFGFKNLSGRADEAWLSTAIAEMLTTEVSAGETLRAIPGENVAKMKLDLALPDADSYGNETLQQIRTNSGTDYVVMGSYLALGNGQVRLDLRLENTKTGELLHSLSSRGTESQLDDLVSLAGAKLRAELGAGEVTSEEAAEVKASRPSSPEAERLYAEGLTQLRKFDNLRARDLLEKAIAADPNFANAHAALASIFSAQGYATKAKDEAQKALSLSQNLSREDRMAIEARFYVTNAQYDKAAETYRTLWKLYPDNIAYGLELAAALTEAGKPTESLGIVDAMRKLPSPENQNPLIDIREAVAAGALGDFKREQAAAATAAEKGRRIGARLLTANAQYTEGWAWAQLGESQKAMAAAEQSRDLYAATGDPRGAGSLTLIGSLLEEKGDMEGALQAFELYYRLAREKGSVDGMGFAQNDIATVMVSRGDLAGAAKSLWAARDAFHEAGDLDAEGYALNNIAPVLLEQGNLNAAEQADEAASAIFRQVGDKDGIAYSLVNRGNILDARGDLAGAKKSYEDAQAMFGKTNDKIISGHALDGLAAIAAEQDDMNAARTQLLDAIALWDKLDDKLSSAESRLALADVALNQGNIVEARTLARQALKEFQKQKASDDIILSRTVLARAMLAEGKPEEASKEIAAIGESASKTQNAAVRYQYGISGSRIRAQRGERAAAMATLNSLLAQAAKAGMVTYEFAARLALGEIKMKTAEAARGRAELLALEKEAATRGYKLIERQARVLADMARMCWHEHPGIRDHLFAAGQVQGYGNVEAVSYSPKQPCSFQRERSLAATRRSIASVRDVTSTDTTSFAARRRRQAVLVRPVTSCFRVPRPCNEFNRCGGSLIRRVSYLSVCFFA